MQEKKRERDDKPKKICYTVVVQNERGGRMFNIALAGLVIGIDNHYDFVLRQCEDYICSGDPAFTVRVSEKTVENECRYATDEVRGMSTDLRAYSESICIYREICRVLPSYGAFLFHSAAICCDGKAYLFSAPSGTGKTTHIRQWRKMLGDGVSMINGDKPILRLNDDGGFTVYGTPWAGKECWQCNVSAPLGGICFIDRASENSIVPLTPAEAADRALRQVIFPPDPRKLAEMLALTDKMVSDTPSFLLRCNISLEAAALSYTALTGKEAPDLSEMA